MQKHKQPPIIYKSGEKYPLFNRLSLETTSYCNRNCTFCPVATGRREFQKAMPDEMFVKIIRELYDLNWDGVVQLFLLNEPFIDKDIKKKAAFIRQALPSCTIYCSTNGDVIDFRGKKTIEWSISKLKDLYDSGINSINMNIYDGGPEQAGRYYAIQDYLVRHGIAVQNSHKYHKVNPNKNHITITDMRPERLSASMTDMFYNRTQEERNEIYQAPQHYCARTQRHLVILFNGDVPICCALDPTASETPVAGNVAHSTIEEIWNSDIFYKYRFFTQQAKRVLPGCDTCNHHMAYAYLVRKVDAPTDDKMRWYNEAKEHFVARQQAFVQLQSSKQAPQVGVS